MRRIILFLSLLLSIVMLSAQQSNTMADYIAKPQTYNVFFSFAQLSDTHISVANEQHTADLQKVVDEINANENIAFVIVSGDVTETGDYASLSLAKKLLSRLRCPYYVVPGNNDNEYSASAATDFKRVFGDDRFRILFNGYLFLGVNTGSNQRICDGHIAPQDIAWVERQLKNVGRKTPAFLVTHHPLKTGDVSNWYELTDAVRKYNVQAVLCGHYHRNMIHDFDGIAGIMSRAVLQTDKAQTGYTLYQMSEDSLFVSEKVVGMEPQQWTAMSMSQKFYVEGDQTKYPRPDYSVNSGYKSVKRRWSKSAGYEISASPVVDGDANIYVGDRLGVMHCFAAKNGKELWSYRTAAPITATACIEQDKLIFGSADRNIYCLNRTTGQLLWKCATGAPVVSTPLVVQGVVYMGASDGVFRAINAASGQVVWSYDRVGGFQQSRPSLHNGMIVFGAADGAVYALRASDGALVWRSGYPYAAVQKDDLPAGGLTQIYAAPVATGLTVVDGKVLFTAPDGYVTALDAESGARLWRNGEYKVIESMGVSEDNKSLFCRSIDGRLVAIDTQKPDMTVLWSVEGLYDKDTNSSQIIERNGRVYLTTNQGMIVCVDTAAKAVVWKCKVCHSAVNTVAFADDNRCVVTSANGEVSLIAIP